MPEPTEATPKKVRARSNWKSVFIQALANSGNVRAACQAANVNRQHVYAVRDKSETFRRDWDVAIEQAVDLLAATAWQRARSGESDTLLIFLMKAHRPALYRETIHHKIDITTVIRNAAEAAGLDPEEAVRAAEELLASPA